MKNVKDKVCYMESVAKAFELPKQVSANKIDKFCARKVTWTTVYWNINEGWPLRGFDLCRMIFDEDDK